MEVIELRQTKGNFDQPQIFKTKNPQVVISQRGICQTAVARFRQPLIFLIFEKFGSLVLKSVVQQKGQESKTI